MNRKFLLSRDVPFILAALALAGCSSAIVEACPTSEPCQVNSPPACPTGVPQLPIVNAFWYDTFSDRSAYTLLFEPEDKCTVTENFPFSLSQEQGYEIVVDDNAHQNYMVVTFVLESGTTIDDVNNWIIANPSLISYGPPPGMIRTAWVAVNPMTRTFHSVTLTESPFYFGCIVQGPGLIKFLTFDGPYELAP